MNDYSKQSLTSLLRWIKKVSMIVMCMIEENEDM
jgi:hypothetical protein